MSDHTERNDANNERPEDELRRLLEQLLGGGSGAPDGIDMSQLAAAAGLPTDPGSLTQFLAQLQRSMQVSAEGIDWNLVRDAAKRAAVGNSEVDASQRQEFDQAFTLAQLWLGEVTSVGDLTEAGRTLTRHEWIVQTLPAWQEMCDPVGRRISDALVDTLAEQTPEQLRDMVTRSSGMVRSMGHSMFAMQMGHTIGKLAEVVLAGGDIGMPVLPHGRAALVPQNVIAWAEGLEVPQQEVVLWCALREVAHAQLFQHAKWLRLHLETSIAEFAAGISIDTDQIEQTVRELDLSDPTEIRQVLASGELIPPRTPEQQEALDRLETMVALIEGWVDVVTTEATRRLPHADAIAEMMRRRRATGSPAERAFGSLVGLEIRPRRLREAAAMWRTVSERLGADVRDSLWDHRDALPDANDIDSPEALVDRLAGAEHERPMDELDSDLQRLLDNPDAFGDAPADGDLPRN